MNQRCWICIALHCIEREKIDQNKCILWGKWRRTLAMGENPLWNHNNSAPLSLCMELQMLVAIIAYLFIHIVKKTHWTMHSQIALNYSHFSCVISLFRSFTFYRNHGVSVLLLLVVNFLFVFSWHKCSQHTDKTRQDKINGMEWKCWSWRWLTKNWEEYMYFMIIWLTDTSFHAILKTFLHPICLILFWNERETVQWSV